MSANGLDPGRDTVSAVGHSPVPAVEAMRMPKALLSVAMGLGGTSLDHNWFAFGRVYRVKKTLKANRLGHLEQGDVVRFLGAYVFPYDNGLRLHFEPEDQPGAHFALEFEGNFPEADGVIRMIDTNNMTHFFRPVDWGQFPERRAEVLQAEVMLRAEAAKAEVLTAEAIEAAKPDYQRKLESVCRSANIGVSSAYGYVMGGNGITTHEFDHGPLNFGHVYRTRKDFRANREGGLRAGQVVHFLGADLRHEQELTLRFEVDDGSFSRLAFYPIDAASCPVLAELASVFQALPDGSTPRSIQILKARAILDDLRQQREAAE